MRRPSTSIVNGSARSRSKNAYFQHGSKSLDINQSMVDGEYLELVDGRSAIVQKGLNAVVNDIRGGEVGAVENTIG
ncbi:MAG: hypothetical protein MMC33_007983, partial [Icmadophila ericetorum]|nr:hypothetical protein [Icmadophila ericetorum]